MYPCDSSTEKVEHWYTILEVQWEVRLGIERQVRIEPGEDHVRNENLH